MWGGIINSLLLSGFIPIAVLLRGLVLLLLRVTLSDVVTPSYRASVDVNVREHPNADSQILKVLKRYRSLNMLVQCPSWHASFLTKAQHGVISKAWIRVETASVTGNFTIDVVDVGTGLASNKSRCLVKSVTNSTNDRRHP